jgi:paraquat-inducible protein B
VKTKVSPAVVGFFVLGGLALGFVALLSFGGVHFFSKPQRFIVYFDESVHGLDLGSPVKLRGVRVGRVVALNVRYEESGNRAVIPVVCELSRNVVYDTEGQPIDLDSRAELERLVEKGLRAQLGVVGLATGLLYVELTFVDPTEFPAPEASAVDVRFANIPALPSAISEFQASLTEILSDLKRVDFTGLSRELRGLLVDARRQVNGADLTRLVDQWTRTAQAVETLAGSPEFREAAIGVSKATEDLRALVSRVDGQVVPAGENLNATLVEAKAALASFKAASDTLNRFVSAQQNLGADSAKALTELAEAAEAVRRLADFLERNPRALLSGRPPPETP